MGEKFDKFKKGAVDAGDKAKKKSHEMNIAHKKKKLENEEEAKKQHENEKSNDKK